MIVMVMFQAFLARDLEGAGRQPT